MGVCLSVRCYGSNASGCLNGLTVIGGGYREERIRTHDRFGWFEAEVVGPYPGEQVLATERKLKKWLRKEVGLAPGTHENCSPLR